jgi:cytochrome oxidase assembly protein ShyY1
VSSQPASYARSGQWLPVLAFMLVMAIGCVLLARWQWLRLEDRRVDNAVISAGISSAPASVATLARAAEQGQVVDWRRASATGRYDVRDEVVVRNRSLAGNAGYYVATPLRTDAGLRVWVVRGWIPAGPDARTPSSIPDPPSGTVEVTGFLRPFEQAVDESGLPAGQVQRLSSPALGADDGAGAARFWLQAIDETPVPAEAPDRLPPPSLSEGPHLGYAVQWVLFSIGAVVGGVVLIRRQREYFAEDVHAAGDSGPETEE